MPLLDPGTQLPLEQLLALRATLLEDLRGGPEMLTDPVGASEVGRARSATARQLVLDALAWAERAPSPSERGVLAAEINLLYDVTVVVAEYYKLFVRPPTPGRPAGRI
jgi:hypothetical protein